MALTRWLALAVLVLLWLPVGAAQLPVVAYVRGISADLSVTTVCLAILTLAQRLCRGNAIERREKLALYAAVAAAALLVYPSGLGWGNWDAYRLGWGGVPLWVGLAVVAIALLLVRVRSVPVVIAIALLAWSADLLESTNLWDYLFDPWLAAAALVQCSLAVGWVWQQRRHRAALAIAQQLRGPGSHRF